MSEQARIGARMKTLRDEKRMSQANLSAALGVSRMTINNYEQGKRIPDVDFSLLTAEYFGVTVEYLSGRTEFQDKEKAIDSYGFRENQHIGEISASCAGNMQKELLGWVDIAINE